MAKSSKFPPTSCPTCEFTHGHGGKPQICTDGTLYCHSCQSTWRELTNKSSTQVTNTGASDTDISTDASQNSVSAFCVPDFAGKLHPKHSGPHSGSVAYKYCVAILAVFGVFFMIMAVASVIFDQPNGGNLNASMGSDELVLGNIKIENRRNRNASILVISANIYNPTPNFLRIPLIQMSSGTKGSSGYFNRTYQPALQNLAPGANLKIRTTVGKPAQSANDVKLEFVGSIVNSG